MSTLLQKFDKTTFETETSCKANSSFVLASSSDLRLMLSKISKSAAPHDIFPAHVLKFIISSYLESLTDVINWVLLMGVFTTSLKQGIN